jgi:hypothetical protein
LFGGIALDEITPSLSTVRATAYQTEIHDVTPPWSVIAYAVCADPIPGLTIVSTFSPADSLDKSVDVNCPAGTKVHGLGGDLLNRQGQAFMVALSRASP